MSSDTEKSVKQRQRYRLAIFDFNTLKEIRSYDFDMRKIYLLLSLLAILFCAAIVALIYLTPLRRTVPGYGDIKKDKTYQQLVDKFEKMEAHINTQEVYIENLKNRLVGNVEEMSQAPVNIQSEMDRSLSTERIAEDEKLRKELERKRILEKQNPAPEKEYNAFFVPPIKGTISAEFMPEENHLGIDIVAAANSPVKAAADGYVVMSDWTEAHGNVIAISHTGNLLTFYKHNSSILKKEGELVRAGEAIAVIGNTGKLTDGPHLHFEIWKDGRPLDPADEINFDF